MRIRFIWYTLFGLLIAQSASSETLMQKDAETVLVNGEVVASKWGTKNPDLHITRVIYKKRYYACRTFTYDLEIQIVCDKVSD